MTSRIFAVLLVACVLNAAETAKIDSKASGLDASRLSLIPRRMKSFVERKRTAGIVRLVQRRGVLGSLEAVGMQDIERNIPTKTDTIFVNLANASMIG